MLYICLKRLHTFIVSNYQHCYTEYLLKNICVCMLVLSIFLKTQYTNTQFPYLNYLITYILNNMLLISKLLNLRGYLTLKCHNLNLAYPDFAILSIGNNIA